MLALEMKITTEIHRNVKLVRWLKEKAICLTLTEENKLHFRAKIGRGYTGTRHFTHEFLQSLSMKNDPKPVKFDHNSRELTLEGMEENVTGRLNPKWVRFEFKDFQNRSEL